jgi:hypothetical protein
MTIQFYEVVTGIGLFEINKVVKEHIKEGWQPFGGISTNTWTDLNEHVQKTQYSQVMVKFSE